ncbi:MAG TPA: DUF397 domain-containing protein [Thermobifida alba]|nr:DUF397 domain-containing protein [Thermobifida alba]
MNQDDTLVLDWRISSYSPSGGKSCVEVGWHISSYSANGGGRCVEAGPLLDTPARVAVRDSTQRGLGFLTFPAAEWHAFLRAATNNAL